MARILALDTATDACSVAVELDGDVRTRRELIPRQHNQLVFSQLRELAPAGPAALELDCIAYAHGPGSFTGLRIAASAVQGLAYSLDLPVAQLSTLACMAQGAWRRGDLDNDALALVLLDARINEIYWGLYACSDGLAQPLCADVVCAPQALALPEAAAGREVVALGSGLAYRDQIGAALDGSRCLDAEAWPDAVDLLPLARAAIDAGALVAAEAVCPVYLRDDIGWKKLSEQGPRR